MNPFSGKKKARFVPRERVIVLPLFSSATFGLHQTTVSESTARKSVIQGSVASLIPQGKCLIDLLEKKMCVCEL